MGDQILHARQRRLLSILNAKHGIESGRELGAKLGVSERTIRNDINEINEKLEPYGIRVIPSFGKGYSLSVRDWSVFPELFSEKENFASRDDRILTMLKRLIRFDDWYSLGDLEDDMFVSRTTLEHDLRLMKDQVSNHYPYLQLQRRGNYICFEPDERKKRAILVRLYAAGWDYDQKNGILLDEESIRPDILRQIQKEVTDLVYENFGQLDDYSLVHLVMTGAVLYQRVKSGHPLPDITAEGEIVPELEAMLGRLADSWQIRLNREEYVWFSEIYNRVRILTIPAASKNQVLQNTDPICHQIVNDLLTQIEKHYQMDFSGDTRFFMDLVLHVQAILFGIISEQVQSRLAGEEMRQYYPFLADIAHMMRLYLEEQCEANLGPEEEHNLIPILICAQRTLYKEKRGDGVKAAVVSHMSPNMTHFLMVQLEKYYGDVLDLRGPYPVYARRRAEAEEPALVFCTVRKDHFSFPDRFLTITVSPLLHEQDRIQIESALTNIRCQILYDGLPSSAEDFLPQSRILRMPKKESLRNVFREIIGMQQADLDDLSVLPEPDLEGDYFTILENGFLFGYQECSYAEKTGGSLVRLQKPVSYRNLRNIETILYFVIRPEDKHYLGWFYRMASALASSPELLERLMMGEISADHIL